MKRTLRVAMLSVHTCPLATLGGKKTGGMNVYVRDLSIELGRRGLQVDVFTRSQDPCVPHVNNRALGTGVRVIHVPCGPESPMRTSELFQYLPQFVDGVRAFAVQEGLTYDVLHSHYWLSGWVARALRDEWSTPIVQMFHTLGRMKDRIAQQPGDHEAPLRARIEHELIHSVDCLIAATPA
jgi:D-inositol-3-phosphate glycosyltransferase